YFVVSNGGAYTKHIYAANQRIASKLGNVDGFGADPRRVEQAGGLKKTDNLATSIKARYESLGIDYEEAEKEDVLPDSTMDSEEPENLVFFYHPDHLGSTSYVTDADGNIAQHIEYIPYGEVFVEERNNSFSTNYLFNAKELDNETGLYYYGARYLDPTGAMWLSVDPMWEKNIDATPYNYCHGNPVRLIDPDGMDDEAADLPVFYVHEKKWPNVYKNHENAVSKGKPLRLTYDSNLHNRNRRRRESIGSSGIERKAGMNIDEYPYACTKEGGNQAVTRVVPESEEVSFAGVQSAETLSVPESENKSHGGALGAFIKQNKLKTGDQFLVVLVPNSEKEKEPVPQPVPQPFPLSVPKPQSDNFIKRVEDFTHLTGWALVGYLVISEGSRILFPARNLIPAP
ncbi:MAG: hypothetical protein K6E14_06935, partial [Paludibacteraceae bacterium]|nr:hypothetical protein [Paludibacteraceae bacterium]